MKTIKITSKDFEGKYISNQDLDNFNVGEFIRIEIVEFPSLLVIGQVQCTEVNGKLINIIPKYYNFYNSNENPYPVFYFAITKLMYHSIMYLRHLPIKSFNRFREKERFEHELNNINLLFRILQNNENYLKELENYWINPQNIDIMHLIELAKENKSANWDITDTRMKLFNTLTDRLAKIDDLYKKRKFKAIREIGYEIHNLPQMLCDDKIYEHNFN